MLLVALGLTPAVHAARWVPADAPCGPQVFSLPYDRVLDEDALQEILISGHSRIPLHEPGDRCAAA